MGVGQLRCGSSTEKVTPWTETNYRSSSCFFNRKAHNHLLRKGVNCASNQRPVNEKV